MMHDSPAAFSRTLGERLGWRSLGFLLLGYSLLLRIPGLLYDLPLHSDAGAFLQVVALLRGEWGGLSAPFRIEYPIYPYLVFFANHLVPDWVLAAKWAAFLPSVLAPLVVFGATLVLSRDRYAALFAGFLTASSSNLIRIGAAPLYDSTFIFMFALFLLVGLLFVRRPNWRMAILVGIVTGLCWATRALGLFLVLPLLSMIVVLPDVSPQRKCRLSLIALVFFLLTASLARVPAKMAARALPEDQTECVKGVILDGIRYAGENRDMEVYRLNESATAFQFVESSPCKLTWRQFAAAYYRDQLKAFVKNLKRIILYDLVTIVTPFIVFFIPLTLGSRLLLSKARWPECVLLGATCVFFLILISAIQYQDRYLFPLIIPLSMVAGIGCSELWREGQRGRWVLLLLMTIAVIGGIDGSRQTMLRDESEANYRKACEWIVARNGKAFGFNVMARHHGVYAYLKHGLVLLPVDEPQKVMNYAEHTNVKYILEGPEERRQNPLLFSNTASLLAVGDFGTGPQSVQVFETIHDIGGAHDQ